MYPFDAHEYIESKRRLLIAEAEQARLAALVPHTSHGGVRHMVAGACYRVAGWLDGEWYGRPAESGRDDWVSETVAA
ncbi:MAG TPA: hypothetical protein VGL99_33580 [Chloroflexota bacterium]